MTRYDEPGASDGRGGPHPLRGVPQEALDAAAETLAEALRTGVDMDQVESVAHAVLASGLVHMDWRPPNLLDKLIEGLPKPQRRPG